ncbi:AI-2E family transporter [Candidatus Woesearchaeota archaeon]|nr:AI-2E family transporter [Candidatus Woesearchaeota archaeon]
MGFEEHKRKLAFSLIFIFLLVVAFLMFQPYLTAILVGALLAYFIKPLYLKILPFVKSKAVAKTTIGIGAGLLLLIVVFIIAFPLAAQAQSLYIKSGQMVSSFVKDIQSCEGETSKPMCQLVQGVSPLFDSPEFRERSNELLQKVSLYIYDKITGFIASIVSFIIFFLVMVFSLFYFLDHGEEIKTTILSILPLTKSDKRRIVQRLEESIKAVIGGNVTTAFLQGVASSLIFALLGVPSPLFWGMLIAFLAFIPGLGPSLIWIPITIIFVIQGAFLKAFILVAASLLILTSIETLLKPKIIGAKIQMSTYAVFMSVLGGLQLFGLLGFFFGPLLLALLITCTQIYREMDENSKD